MEMKPTFNHTVLPDACDSYGFMKPSYLILRLVDCVAVRNREEGAGKNAIREAYDAVWMIRRLRFQQFKPIRCGDFLEGFGSGRTLLEENYVFHSDFYVSDELVASMDFYLMPVGFKSREKIDLALIEQLFTTEPTNDVPTFPRLSMRKGLEYPLRKKILPEDCDANKHFAAQNYSEIIGQHLGYYDAPEHLYKVLQMDYVHEILPGKTMKLAIKPKGDGHLIQGKHMSSFPCFNAYCEII